MMRANIGNAVMAMAAPRNSDASTGLMRAANRPGIVKSQGVNINANTNGAAMPATDTDKALR